MNFIERLRLASFGIAINAMLLIWGWQRWNAAHKKSGAFLLITSGIGMLWSLGYIFGIVKFEDELPDSERQGLLINK